MGTTAQKLQNIINEKASQKTITNYGLSVANQIDNNTKFIDYPKYIFKGYIESLNNPSTLYNNLPKKTGTGTNITLNDTTECRMEIGLYGDSSQASTPTPSSPVAVESVTGLQNITTYGKNLFLDSDTFERNVSSSWTIDGDIDTENTKNGSYSVRTDRAWNGPGVNLQQLYNKGLIQIGDTLTYSIYFKTNFVPSGTIPFSLTFYRGASSGGVTVKRYQYNEITPNEWYRLETTFEVTDYSITSNRARIELNYYDSNDQYYFGNERTNYVWFSQPQVEKSSSVTDYEPYIEQINEINLGKNLFQITQSSGTYNELTFTKIDDNTFNIKGTTTSNARSLTLTTNYPTLIEGEKYTYSVEVLEGTFAGSLSMAIYNADGTIRYNYFGLGNALRTQTNTIIANKGIYSWTYYIGTNTTVDVTLRIQFEKSPIQTSYSPYFEPIELCKIGDYQDRIYKSSGKNLNFTPYKDGTSKTTNGINFSVKNTGEIIANNTATANAYFYCHTQDTIPYLTLPKGKYYLSGCPSGGANNKYYLRLTLYNGSTSAVSFTDYGSGVSIDTNTYTYDRVMLYVFIANGQSCNNLTFAVMLNEGTTALDYEPYGEPSWYIKKWIGKVVLDGSENWTVSKTGTSNWYYNLSTSYYPISNVKTTSNGLSSHYIPNEIGNTDTNQGFFLLTSGVLRIRYGTEDTTTNFKTWLNSNNVTIYYALATPTYTEITNSELIGELESLYNATSYSPQTNISQQTEYLPFILNVSAIEDLS